MGASSTCSWGARLSELRVGVLHSVDGFVHGSYPLLQPLLHVVEAFCPKILPLILRDRRERHSHFEGAKRRKYPNWLCRNVFQLPGARQKAGIVRFVTPDLYAAPLHLGELYQGFPARA